MAMSDEKRLMGQRLRKRGFKATYDKESRGYHVHCDQCQALCINGVATHEQGCPNAKGTDALRRR